jgi:hypothetical protein
MIANGYAAASFKEDNYEAQIRYIAISVLSVVIK